MYFLNFHNLLNRREKKNTCQFDCAVTRCRFIKTGPGMKEIARILPAIVAEFPDVRVRSRKSSNQH